MVVHWWKQKAEDEERCARKPAGCGCFAPLVPALENKRKTGREDRGEGERGREGREDGMEGGKKGGTNGVVGK